MNFDEVINALGLSDKNIRATLINPLRNGEIYKYGKVIGFKAGQLSGHSKYKKGIPQRFDGTKMRWIKKPKVFIAYDIFTFGKSQLTDWVDIDNCEFEILDK